MKIDPKNSFLQISSLDAGDWKNTAKTPTFKPDLTYHVHQLHLRLFFMKIIDRDWFGLKVSLFIFVRKPARLFPFWR